MCIEASITRLNQLQSNRSSKKYYLIDGFSPGIVPTFDLANFAWKPKDTQRDIILVYYWKLHGSIDWTYSMPFNIYNDSNIEYFGDEAIICKRIPKKQWEILYECSALATRAEWNKHKIVIFPTPIKYSQTYTYPYIDLYEAFRRTLEEIELLLVVGTSFPDQHIKSAVKSFIQRKETLLYVIDPSSTMSKDNLKELFGNFDSIQDVISLGFLNFVNRLKVIEELETTSGGNINE